MYDELYRAWKSEKSTVNLQPLPSDFYQRAQKYLGSLDQESNSDTGTVQNRIFTREKELAERLLDELKRARRAKIFKAAQDGITINSSSLTEEENGLATKIMEPTTSSVESEKRGEAGTVVVRFLQDIPEIVGVDLRIYGPFKKEDVASVPHANAEALVAQGSVRVIDFKTPD